MEAKDQERDQERDRTTEKKALRKLLLGKRQMLTADERRRYDAAIWQQVQALPEIVAAKTILLYLDFRGEVESEAMIAWGLAKGKTICAPVTVKAERRLIPVPMSSVDDVVIGAYDIREPRDQEHPVAVEAIDAVVLPGVGFDRQGGRLGYGGGYYDRFLPRLRNDVFKVAVAYECQVWPDLPLEPHDTPLDALVTEQGVWRTE